MLRAFQIEKQTTAPTSLHVYFILSDSCTVFLHLCKSIFLLLPSRSSEQCSLWLLGSIKVCQMNRKNHALRGNEKLSKAAWNLKHFFSAIFCFFSFGERRQTQRFHSVGVRRLCPFGSLFDLFSDQVRTVNRAKPKKCEHSLESEFGLVIKEVWNQWMCHGFVTTATVVHKCNIKGFFFL